MQEHPRGAAPPALVDGALKIADAFLLAVVVVGVAGDADALGAVHERLADRMKPIHVGNGDVAFAAVHPFVGQADAPFAALEIGQDVRVAPAAIAALRPMVEIRGLAAIVDHAVDGTAAAQRAALRGEDLPAAAAFARFGLELPRVFRIEQHLDEAGGHMDVGVIVGRAGFQDADLDPRILRQAPGQHRPGRPRADDHVVKCFPIRRRLVVRHLFLPPEGSNCL